MLLNSQWATALLPLPAKSTLVRVNVRKKLTPLPGSITLMHALIFLNSAHMCSDCLALTKSTQLSKPLFMCRKLSGWESDSTITKGWWCTQLMGHPSCWDRKLHATVSLYLFCWYFYIRELSFIVAWRSGVEGVRMLNVLLHLIECMDEGRVETFCRHVHRFCPSPPSPQVIVTES